MIGAAARRPLGTLAVWAALAILGFWQLPRLPVTLLPAPSHGVLLVEAEWPGASPLGMEAAVTSLLEAATRRVRGVRHVRSVSELSPGGGGSVARLEAELTPGRSRGRARMALGERIAGLRRVLPAEARVRVGDAVVGREEERARGPLMVVLLRGPYTAELLIRLARDRVRPALLSVPGVGEVRVRGRETAGIVVAPSTAGLRSRGLTVADVVSSLAPPPGGATQALGSVGEAAVPVFLEWPGGETGPVRDLPVSGEDPGVTPGIGLGRVASVRRGAGSRQTAFRVRGEPAVALEVTQRRGTRSGRVARGLRRRVADLREALPKGTELVVDRDEGAEWEVATAAVVRRSALSAAVVLLVLVLALRSGPAVAVVAGSAVLGILGGVLALAWRGGGLDLHGLAGLAWAGGLVVDGGLVVAELAGRRLRSGETPPRAAAAAAREAAPALVGAAVTTAAALSPLATLHPETVRWLPSFATAVGGALLVGLAASLSFVPAALGLWTGRSGGPGPARSGPRSGGARGSRPATTISKRLLRRPRTVLLLGGAGLVAALLFAGSHVHRWPRWEGTPHGGDRVLVDVRLDRGSAPAAMARVAERLEARLGVVGAADYRSWVRPASVRVRVDLPGGAEGPASGPQVMARMVAAGAEVAGADVRVIGLGPGFRRRSDVRRGEHVIRVLGPDFDGVHRLAEEVARRLAVDRRVRDVDPLGAEPWHRRRIAQEVRFAVRAAGTGGGGRPVPRVAAELGPLIRGATVAGARVDGGGTRVRARPSGAPPALASLPSLRVAGEGGVPVPLGRVFAFRSTRVPDRVVRTDRRYRLVVSWGFAGPRPLADRALRRALRGLELPEGYEVRPAGIDGRWLADERRLAGAVAVAVLAVFLVCAALLESWSRAGMVLLPVPAALAGAGLALVVADQALAREAFASLALAVGVVVDAGLLVVHRAGRLTARGLSAGEAALRATLERAPTVTATAATTVAGCAGFLLPRAAAGLDVWPTMSTASIGALIAGALAALTLVPAAFAVAGATVGRAGRRDG